MATPATPKFPSFASLIQTCKSGFAWLLCLCLIAGFAQSVSALTLHRSFRTREVGFGGGVSASVPVDSKVAAALDEAAAKDAAKTKVIIGKCTRVSDGDTIHVVTDGNVKFKVRLDRIDAPESDQPYGKESTAYLTSLIRGKTVRVEWQKKDQYGRILGIVYLPNAVLASENGEAVSSPLVKNDPSAKLDVNLTMVATGVYGVLSNLILVDYPTVHRA